MPTCLTSFDSSHLHQELEAQWQPASASSQALHPASCLPAHRAVPSKSPRSETITSNGTNEQLIAAINVLRTSSSRSKCKAQPAKPAVSV